jgi:hypothetical protein
VLVAGGVEPGYEIQTAELYDPAEGRWTSALDKMSLRADATATPIVGTSGKPDGYCFPVQRVLVTSGLTSELFGGFY